MLPYRLAHQYLRMKENFQSRIAEAIPKAIETNTGANAFGKACFTIALKLEYPNDLAACTNSNSLKRKNSALVKRAIPVQEVKPIMVIINQMLLVK